jgi:AcrR family transcriptional regulator
LTREQVTASQRSRLLEAIVEVVSEKGYAATTVGDVVERAGVSRRTFYEQFPDKEACFLAAYDTGVQVMLARMHEAVSRLRDGGLESMARASIAAYLDALAAEPSFAWALHREVFAAGPQALERREEIISLLASQWRRLYLRARSSDPRLAAPPRIEVLRAIVVSQEELVREHLRTADPGTLPGLLSVALTIALRLLGTSPTG